MMKLYLEQMLVCSCFANCKLLDAKNPSKSTVTTTLYLAHIYSITKILKKRDSVMFLPLVTSTYTGNFAKFCYDLLLKPLPLVVRKKLLPMTLIKAGCYTIEWKHTYGMATLLFTVLQLIGNKIPV